MKSKKTETIVGLDIGSHSVKCVEVLQSGASIELQRAEILPLTGGLDIPKALGQLNLSSARHVRVAISGSSVIIRRISMPLLTPRELEGAIRFEAESHIPFSIEDCLLDYQILKQDSAKKEMSILLVAAKKDLVDARCKLLAEAGIYPEVMDLDIFCLVNAFSTLNPACEEKSYGLLNIGHKMSAFAIVDDGLPLFVREITTGGSSVTNALAETKAISEAEAGVLKIQKPAAEETFLKAATEKGFEPLCEEIRHSIDYVENEMKEGLKKIYLSGGGALAANALELLAEETGKPFELWDPTKNLRPLGAIQPQFLKEHGSELVVALGMTLRGLGGFRK